MEKQIAQAHFDFVPRYNKLLDDAEKAFDKLFNKKISKIEGRQNQLTKRQMIVCTKIGDPHLVFWDEEEYFWPFHWPKFMNLTENKKFEILHKLLPQNGRSSYEQRLSQALDHPVKLRIYQYDGKIFNTPVKHARIYLEWDVPHQMNIEL